MKRIPRTEPRGDTALNEGEEAEQTEEDRLSPFDVRVLSISMYVAVLGMHPR